jgi:hypothetical protein
MSVEAVLTPEFRVSYANVFKPQKNDLSGKMEFSLVAIFPKGSDLSELKKAAEACIAEKYGTDKSKWPSNMRNPFRKCSERWKNEGGEQKIPAGYEDGEAIFITMKANEDRRPGVVDQNVQDILEPRDFYSGAYARCKARPYFYDQKGNKGVSFGLGNVQKLRDGEPLGGGPTKASDDFAPVAGGASSGGASSVFDD